MPLLSTNHAFDNFRKSTTSTPLDSTSTTRNRLFRELEKNTLQFNKVERAYIEENKLNLERSIEKFIKLIVKSIVFKIDFFEDEVIVIPARRGAAGMKDLRSLIDNVKFHEMDSSDDKIYLAMLKNFYEQFLEWSRTYKDEPPPGFVPQFNRGRVNLLQREKGRHKYGS